MEAVSQIYEKFFEIEYRTLNEISIKDDKITSHRCIRLVGQ